MDILCRKTMQSLYSPDLFVDMCIVQRVVVNHTQWRSFFNSSSVVRSICLPRCTHIVHSSSFFTRQVIKQHAAAMDP